MANDVDLDKFDDDDKESAVFSMFSVGELKDIDDAKLKLLLDHDRRIRRMRAIRKIILAIITAIPTILVMIKQFLP